MPAPPAPPADVPPAAADGAGGMLADTQPGSPPEAHVKPHENRPVGPEKEATPPLVQVPDETIPMTPVQTMYSPESPPRETRVDDDGLQKRKAMAIPLDEDENGKYEIFVPVAMPPEALTDRAIYMRLNRVFKKRKDGNYLLDDYWNNAWADIDGGGRDSVKALFEKVGYQKDRVRQKMCFFYNNYVLTSEGL